MWLTTAWRSVEIAFYAVSLVAALAFVRGTSAKPGGRLGAPLRRFEELVNGLSLTALGTIPFIFAAAFVWLHASALANPGMIKASGVAWWYYDLETYWVPAAASVARGENPYADFVAQPDYYSGINYGVLYPWTLGLAYALGGTLGIVVVLTLIAACVPLAVAWAGRASAVPERSVKYLCILATFLPLPFLFPLHFVQDEPITSVGIVATFALYLLRRPLAAAGLVGLISAVKYAPLLFFVPLVAMDVGAAWRATRGPRRYDECARTLLPGCFAVWVFLATTLIGYVAYGNAFLRRTGGILSLAQSSRPGHTLINGPWLGLDPAVATIAFALTYLAFCATMLLKARRVTPLGASASAVVVFCLLMLFMPVSYERHNIFGWPLIASLAAAVMASGIRNAVSGALLWTGMALSPITEAYEAVLWTPSYYAPRTSVSWPLLGEATFTAAYLLLILIALFVWHYGQRPKAQEIHGR